MFTTDNSAVRRHADFKQLTRSKVAHHFVANWLIRRLSCKVTTDRLSEY